MEDYDFSKGHPIDTDLIEYNSKVDFLTNSSGKINYNLLLNGSVAKQRYFQPFSWKNDYIDYIPNFVFPDKFSSVNPTSELLSVIKTIKGQTGTKEHTYLDGVQITDEDEGKYFISKDKYNLKSISTSSLKDNIIVEEVDSYFKIKTGEIEVEQINKQGEKFKRTILPEKIMYINKDDYNKGISVSKYGEDYDEINKEIIVALEFQLYENLGGLESANNNAISRLTALYKSEFLYVYNKNRMSAEVDNDTLTIDPRFEGINKFKISDIKYYTQMAIGDNDYTSNKKIFIMPDPGYALSGIAYVERNGRWENRFGTMPISQIVFAFDSIYEPAKETQYYYLNNGNLVKNASNPLADNTNVYSFNMRNHDKKIFISTFDLIYAPQPTEQNMATVAQVLNYVNNVVSIVMLSLVKFPVGILLNFFNPAFWESKWDISYHNSEKFFSGVKGVLSIQTISLKNNLVYDWLKDYDSLRSCDTIVDNLYDPETLEEIYGKFIKDYYITDSKSPSAKCFTDVLYPYCNAYKKQEYFITFSEEQSQIIFETDNKTVILKSNDLKSTILSNINSLLDINEVKCFDISTNVFDDTLTFTFIFYKVYSKKLEFKIYDSIGSELEVETYEDEKILEGDRCKFFCRFSQVNCDAAINKYCKASKNYPDTSFYYYVKLTDNQEIKFKVETKEIQLGTYDQINKINSILPSDVKCIDVDRIEVDNALLFIFNNEVDFQVLQNNTNLQVQKKSISMSNIEEPYLLPKTFSFTPQYVDINLPLLETSITLLVPNQKKIFTKDTEICGCYFASNRQHIEKILKFYDNIKSKYISAYNTETDQIKKQKLNDELSYIDYLKKTSVLTDSEESFKLALKLQLQEPKLIDNYKTECSFPPCAKTSYKLFSMKNKDCKEDQNCIGKGFAFPTGNDTTIGCNEEKGLENLRCVINKNNELEPTFTLLQDLINFKACEDIYKTQIPYEEVERPSYCKYADLPRAVGCVGNQMKYVYDINQGQYPPWREDLCPPPNDQLPIGYTNPDLRYDYDNCVKKAETTKKPDNKNIIIVAVSLFLIFLVIIFFIIKKKLK